MCNQKKIDNPPPCALIRGVAAYRMSHIMVWGTGSATDTSSGWDHRVPVGTCRHPSFSPSVSGAMLFRLVVHDGRIH